MALIEMDFATGIGEHYEETVLWENPSPSSNFSAQTITLSQSMGDFDMLKFEIRTHVSSPITTELIYVPLSYFNSTSSDANAYKFVLGVYQFTNLFARETYKSSDTQIYISEARRLNASGTSTDQNIPVKIVGLKKINTNDIKVKNGTFYPSTTGEVSVDVGFKPKYLGVIVYKTDGTTLSLSYVYDEEVSTTKYMLTASDRNGGLVDLNTTDDYRLKSIDSNGFTVNKYTSSNWNGLAYYFAVG